MDGPPLNLEHLRQIELALARLTPAKELAERCQRCHIDVSAVMADLSSVEETLTAIRAEFFPQGVPR